MEPPSAASAGTDAPNGCDATLTLRGRVASRGRCAGVARVLDAGADTGRFARGDVLVCRTLRPEWRRLLDQAGAVVAESGGVLSNQATVARERGRPALVAVRGATSLIRDGQRVLVDADRGIVQVL